MSGRVAGKVAIVTGAARGAGRADAEALTREGAKVILVDIKTEDVQQTAEEIGNGARAVSLDVSSEVGWQSLRDFAEREFGRLDILVNNAAILRDGTVQETPLETWQMVQRVNTESVFLGIKHCLSLLEQQGGSIINMASSSALFGMPQFIAYSASKGAVAAMTRAVAVHCANAGCGVRCNAIYPDGINTPMALEQNFAFDMEMGIRAAAFLCEPEDIANTVLFLASDESSSINGTELRVDKSSTITPPYVWPVQSP